MRVYAQAVVVFLAVLFSCSFANPADVCVHDLITRGYKAVKPRLSPLKARYLQQQQTAWRPLKVQYDYSGLEGLDSEKKEFLMNDLIPKVGSLLSSFLSVKYIPGQKWAFQGQKCHKANVSARYRAPVIEADLLIFVTFMNETNASYRAWASSCQIDPITNRPKAGQINFNWATLNTSMTKDEFRPIFHTTLHELTHVLGLSKGQYGRYIDQNGQVLGLNRVIKPVQMRGYDTSIIILPGVVDYVRTFFNCNSLEGAELENQGESGSLGSHWERRIFANEYMTAASRKDQRVSNLTLKLLEGTGWYRIDYSVAGELTFGKNAGCNFNLLPCFQNGKARYHGFCPSAVNKSEGCDFKHHAKSICNLKPPGSLYSDENRSLTLPPAFNYFNGLLAHDHFNDNCPYFRPYSNGHCGIPENKMNQEWLYDEYYGPGSRCFEGDYYKSTARLKNPNLPNHGTCHKYRCQRDPASNKMQVVIVMGNTEVKCPPQGGFTTINGYNGKVKCPVGEEFCRDEGVNACPQKNFCSEIGHCYRGKCICPAGFESETCEISVIDCKKSKCSGHGNCRKDACECFDGWGGAECAEPRATTNCRMCNFGICYGGVCLDTLSHFSYFLQESNIATS